MKYTLTKKKMDEYTIYKKKTHCSIFKDAIHEMALAIFYFCRGQASNTFEGSLIQNLLGSNVGRFACHEQIITHRTNKSNDLSTIFAISIRQKKISFISKGYFLSSILKDMRIF